MVVGRSERSAPPAASAGPFDRQAQVEAEYLRMCRLQRMSSVELSLLLSGDPSEALPWVETAARYGVAEAQLRLGQMRLDGLGGPRDEPAALDCFTRAAKAGLPEAMNMVGRCYENGWGAPEDLAAAADWYRRSAQAGHDWGEYNYANMLFDGRGGACDQAQAVRWYERAAAKGHARAMNLLARCREEGWGTARDLGAALEWYRRSAEGGYFRAQFNYGTILATQGRIDEALVWFDRAAQDAPPEGLRSMVEVLRRQSHPRLASFGRALAERLSATVAQPAEAAS